MKPLDFKQLPTEQQNPASKFLDTLAIGEIIDLMNREDRKIPDALRKEKKHIQASIELIVERLKSGGRIFFVGAGTSGRLGVMESAELPPTFNTPPPMAQAMMAGGRQAVFRSQEGAEDNAHRAKIEIKKRVRKGDVVVGIAASGVTPFVQSALTQAKKVGATTILVTCNAQPPVRRKADIAIAPQVGAEIIAGSTRLKSATATKMILNMLTTASMIQLGKVFGNRMVDLQPKSRKLRERGLRLIQEMTGASRKEAQRFFRASPARVKTAILMARKKISYLKAQAALKKSHGFLRSALKS